MHNTKEEIAKKGFDIGLEADKLETEYLNYYKSKGFAFKTL